MTRPHNLLEGLNTLLGFGSVDYRITCKYHNRGIYCESFNFTNFVIWNASVAN